MRKAAAQALAKTFAENLRTFALVTNVLAKDKEISDRWRGFADVADARHLSNRVEPEVVQALVQAVRAAYPRLSHRYYALKARWFGKKRLPHWDRNAPLPAVATRTIGWSEAQATVLDAYGAFSPEMADIAARFFKNHWIDAPVRPGKAPGAFSHPTVPSAHPYVLLNYQGKPRDVMTLAHELGHGVHQVLAAPNGPLMAPTPMFRTIFDRTLLRGASGPLINEVDAQEPLPVRFDPLTSASAPNTTEPAWYWAPIWPPASHPLTPNPAGAGVMVSAKNG